MQENCTDLRVIRTKQSIRDAFVELLEEKGFESITVKDITSRATINRGTFYAHYQDKFDLMTKCEEEIMVEMSKIAELNFPSVVTTLESNSSNEGPFSIAILMLQLINENNRFLKAVLGPNGDLSFQTRLKDFMWKTIYGIGFIKEENLLVPGPYLASYIASAHIGVIQQWLNSGRKESPEEIARILSTIMVNGPLFAAGLKK
ncbi:TetR/AcrR family transcriptional regulator [Bacillus sp. BGMRC 2118]|nr:TetR/AcrR family transcriptional regulator [Bacillus sp. BGMRC 2118]